MKPSKLRDYVEGLQSRGRYFFTKGEAVQALGVSLSATTRALDRMVAKGWIAHVRKGGFYVIVPPEYRASGILPPDWFIHDLMVALEQPYYVSLLSAAALHGSAHQQPQVFHVVSSRSSRDLMIKGLKIRFFYKSHLKDTPFERIKTSTGYITVSTPAATAMDLIRFERRIGGLDRVLTVLIELQEAIMPDDLRNAIDCERSLSIIQKLGYLMEMTDNIELTDILGEYIGARKPRYIPLSTKHSIKGFPYIARWRIIENEEVKAEL
jgi:predicted transcriptional regulator of viral defense system